MKIKQLLILCCAAAGITMADVPGPAWNTTDAGAVHAEWTDWTFFNTGFEYTPDVYTAYDENGLANDPASAAANGQADAYGDSTYTIDGTGVDGIQIEANWDFSLWVSTYSGFDTQDVYFEVTYWDDELDSSWRQGWEFGLQAVGGSSTVQGGWLFEGESHDTVAGLITEAYSFSIADSADGFFIDFTAEPALDVTNPGYIQSITVDSVSYEAVPEPATLGLLGLGALSVWVVRRSKQNTTEDEI